MRIQLKIPNRPYTVTLYKHTFVDYKGKKFVNWIVTSIFKDRWFDNKGLLAIIYFILVYMKCFLRITKSPNIFWKRSDVCETIFYEQKDGTIIKGRTICPENIESHLISK